MPYHLVFTVFFIHLFFLLNIYIKDEILPPENYVKCDFHNLSAESIKCHQQYLAERKQFLHYVTYLERLDGAEYKNSSEIAKRSIRIEEFRVEIIKLRFRLQKINTKIEKITDTTPPRIVSSLHQQHSHIMIKIKDHFERYGKHVKKTSAFYATISSD